MAIFVSLNPTYVSLLLFILMSGRGEESINVSHDPELCCSEKTRTKKSIRYAKENDRERRERRREGERERKVEGEI